MNEATKAKERFYKFVSFRNRFSLFLSMVIFVVYYIFVAGIGFFPEVLGYRLGPSAITLGIMCGVSLIIICIIATGAYTFFANKYMDKEQQEIVDELKRTGALDELQRGDSIK